MIIAIVPTLQFATWKSDGLTHLLCVSTGKVVPTHCLTPITKDLSQAVRLTHCFIERKK